MNFGKIGLLRIYQDSNTQPFNIKASVQPIQPIHVSR